MTRLSTGAILDTWTFGDNGPPGGGYVTGISISTDGQTKVIRTDVFNGWVKGPSDTVWRQLFNSSSIPSGYGRYDAAYTQNGSPGGVHVAAANVAPSDYTRLYATYGNWLWKSTDIGHTWTKITGLPSGIGMDTNNGSPHPSHAGDCLAIDPNNANVFLFGTQSNGLFYSTDGASVTQFWLQVGGVNQTNVSPTGVPWYHKVAVDPTSIQSGGIRQRWFAMLQGTGVFKSDTGPGGPFTQISGTALGGPSTYVWCLVPDQNGHLWACEYGAKVWRWDATNGWVDSGAPTGMVGVAINPNVAVAPAAAPTGTGHIYVFDNGGSFSWSNNGGYTGTWHAKINSTPTNYQTNTYCTSVYYIAKGNNYGPPGGGVPKFDPSQSNKLYTCSGVGVYWCNPPQTQTPSANQWFNWYEEIAGQKQLVANTALIAPGGFPNLGCWDRPIWYQTDIGAPCQGPFRPVNSALYDVPKGTRNDFDVTHCWQFDYAADNSKWIFAHVNWDGNTPGYSTDGGKTWTPYSPSPTMSGTGGGCAVGNTGNVIVIPSSNGQPIYTKNNGADGWPVLPFPNLPSGSETGFGSFYVNHAFPITYDKTGGAFYLYNYQPKNTTIGGVWTSTNGDTWTRTCGLIDTLGAGSPLRLHSVPGQAGHLLYTSGDVGVANPMYRSTDGGVTFNPVTNVTNVRCIGFGKAAPGQTYPAVYIHGKVSGANGLYVSIDGCVTWTLMAPYPANNMDLPTCLTGHPDRYGWGIIGFQGSGFYYFKPTYPIAITPS